MAARPAPGAPFGAGMLVFGIGNSARADDGLGWAFLDRLRAEPGFAAQAEYRFQLQVEDALLATRFDHVLFVDASCEDLPGGFHRAPCAARQADGFTTHELPPEAVLHYCRTLYGAEPRAETLALQGYRWDLHEGLSARAEANLAAALAACRPPVAA